LRSRRIVSIRSMSHRGVAVGCRRGVEDRSRSPRSPKRRYRFTHFDAVAREIPISAATCAIGRVWQRSISRRRPSGDRGALRCTTGLMLLPHVSSRDDASACSRVPIARNRARGEVGSSRCLRVVGRLQHVPREAGAPDHLVLHSGDAPAVWGAPQCRSDDAARGE
jgi:hypothetical protein